MYKLYGKLQFHSFSIYLRQAIQVCYTFCYIQYILIDLWVFLILWLKFDCLSNGTRENYKKKKYLRKKHNKNYKLRSEDWFKLRMSWMKSMSLKKQNKKKQEKKHKIHKQQTSKLYLEILLTVIMLSHHKLRFSKFQFSINIDEMLNLPNDQLNIWIPSSP